MPERVVQTSDFTVDAQEDDALKREVGQLGAHLLDRAEEVAEQIAARALQKRAQEGVPPLRPSFEESFLRLGAMATAALGRWLVGESAEVASVAGEELSRAFTQLAASGEVPLGEVVRRCRYWRDGCQLALRESAERGMAGAEALAGAYEAIQRAADRTVAQASEIFDGERMRAGQQLARSQRQLSFRATHDPLTQLANRALVLESLQARLALAQRLGREVAVLFIDLDGFKLVNDTLGHSVGDRLLIAVAAALRSLTRKADTIGRYGGDEFVVIADMGWADGSAIAMAIARALLSAFAEPFAMEDGAQPLRIAASIGVALSRPCSSAEQLLADADAAMYCAKARGSGCELFEPSMLERLRGERSLRRAKPSAGAASEGGS